MLSTLVILSVTVGVFLTILGLLWQIHAQAGEIRLVAVEAMKLLAARSLPEKVQADLAAASLDDWELPPPDAGKPQMVKTINGEEIDLRDYEIE